MSNWTPPIPDWADTDKLMAESYDMATWSDDPSTQNGSILIDQARVIGRGFNGFPLGTPQEFWNDRPTKLTHVIHAEVSSILDAARNGNSTAYTTMYCGWASCANCAKHMVGAGVVRLVRHPFVWNETNERWKEECDLGDDIMKRGGIEIVEVDPAPWSGTLRRNGELWAP